MSWFSILPASLSFVETWLIRLFLILGFITIGPWVALIIYDAVFYVFRVATYDIPYIGGRARNRPRPRAPSLSERPNGAKRAVNIPIPPTVASGHNDEGINGVKNRIINKGHGAHEANRSSDD